MGGGFVGGTLAQRLERLLPVSTEIVVVSSENHLVFTPMLPQVVGRTISPLHFVVAGRQRTCRTRWQEARVSRIDPKNNEAHYALRDGTAAKLPTFSRKLEVAISWAGRIPFPPNIVQLRLTEKPSSETRENTASES